MELNQILDKLNDNNTKNNKTNTTVGFDIYFLIMENEIDEAINYIKDFFICDDITATQAINIFKNTLNDAINESNVQPLSHERKAHANEVAREWQNKPKCPTCGSENVQPISNIERGASIITLGIFSNKINKSFKCKNCGYKW